MAVCVCVWEREGRFTCNTLLFAAYLYRTMSIYLHRFWGRSLFSAAWQHTYYTHIYMQEQSKPATGTKQTIGLPWRTDCAQFLRKINHLKDLVCAYPLICPFRLYAHAHVRYWCAVVLCADMQILTRIICQKYPPQRKFSVATTTSDNICMHLCICEREYLIL